MGAGKHGSMEAYNTESSKQNAEKQAAGGMEAGEHGGREMFMREDYKITS